MVWANIAMAVANVAEGYGQASANKKRATAEYKLNKGRAENEALYRASQNMVNMADANVARYQQWRDNAKKLDAMGEASSQETWNYGKQVDALNSSRIQDRLAGASALGSTLAEAAAAGVGGASVEQVYETEKFRQARQDQAVGEQLKDAQYQHALNQVGIMDNGYNSLDGSTVFSSLDYTAQDLVMDNSYQYKYSLAKAGSDAMSGFSGNMNNTGMDFSGMMGGKNTGASNLGLGGKKGPTVKGQGAKGSSGAIRL